VNHGDTLAADPAVSCSTIAPPACAAACALLERKKSETRRCITATHWQQIQPFLVALLHPAISCSRSTHFVTHYCTCLQHYCTCSCNAMAADPTIFCSTIAFSHFLQQIHTLLNALLHLLAALLHLLLQHTGSRSSHFLQQIHTLLNALVHLLAALLHLLLQHTGSRSSHNKTL